jgi:3D (Asp-Asp-Asp) domain-containing protein
MKEKYLIFLLIFSIGVFFDFSSLAKENRISKILYIEDSPFYFFENNTLFYFTPPSKEEKTERIFVLVTGYSSSEDQTDDTPYLTASGTVVRDGVVANNFLPFGTKIKIPALFGDKIFTVEDRLNLSKGNNLVDIWFENEEKALSFGVKKTYIEILK